MKCVGILGGMGPAAGLALARCFVGACQDLLVKGGMPVCDQAFPPHVLLQLPFADRSAALRTGETVGLGEALVEALQQLAALDVEVAAIACNTAHAWHAELQARLPTIELLHVGEVVASELGARRIARVGLMATTGTYMAGVYDGPLAAAGIELHLPLPGEREALMRGIYDGVKAGDLQLAASLFRDVAEALCARHAVEALILGCTEIPLALGAGDLQPGVLVVDPALLLARELARRAYAVTGSP
jgi:aspartate racemase